MIGKQILFGQSIEPQIEDIMNEILSCIEKENKSGPLDPDLYFHILLFLSESLPNMKDKDPWIELGYTICKEIKRNVEKNGYLIWTSMFGGFGYQCFAVDSFCRQANILKSFSHNLNKLLFTATSKRIDQIKNNETHDFDYDLISGVAGNLYYLLDLDCTDEEEQIIKKCIAYLLGFVEDKEYCGQTIMKFHILRSNLNNYFDEKGFETGCINLGLAHGILGPLIALAKAYAKGFLVDGLKEGIEKVYEVYETFTTINEDLVPLWPRFISVKEYVEGACNPEHLQYPSSWCYGNLGIMRGLQKVSGYMNWKEAEESYTKLLNNFFAQDIKTYFLKKPSLCHGFSSLVAIQTCAYYAYEDPKLLTHLERNVRHIISAYQKSNEHEVNLEDIRNMTNLVEGYLGDLTLLTGSIGVAITLLSLKGKIATGKLLMID